MAPDQHSVVPVSFHALRTVDPNRFDASAKAWAGLHDRFRDQMTNYRTEVLEPVDGESWQGAAADSARRRLHQTYGKMGPTLTYLDSVCLLLEQSAAGTAAAKARCQQGIDLATAAGIPLDADGKPLLQDGLVYDISWDRPMVTTAMQAANIIYQARHIASYVDKAVSDRLNDATKFDSGPWMQDAQKDHQDVVELSRKLAGKIQEIAVDEPPHHDTASQPYAVASPGTSDYELWTELSTGGVAYFSAHGWLNTVGLLRHWLDNSGRSYWVDPATMLDEIPGFKREVTTMVSDAGHGRPGEEVFAFDSGWRNIAATEGDWYWSFHDFRYRLTGITNGRMGTEYTVGVLKPYVFGDSAGLHRVPIHRPVVGGEIDQRDIQHLHTTGLAQNFVAQGIAHFPA
ncbi:hypothetical protein [Amycolatopsis pigmentata]|uniref:Uncharacterized protein n=1 Tax=Amycolatopsis pigmentata TaxID=450801 RepID=A0ABW5FND7_9PSEU